MSIDILFLLIYILHLQLSNKRKLKIKVFFKKGELKLWKLYLPQTLPNY